MAIRGFTRYLSEHGAAIRRLAVGDATAPRLAPLYVLPSAAPSGTSVEGDLYWDSTAHALKAHNGTSFSTPGNTRVVKTAAATLTAADSGALCIFNNAAGFTYTLPTAAAGLFFDFVVEVTVTSVAAKVITASASEFLLGTFIQSTDGTYTSAAQAANGTTIRAWSGNGTTTGGLAGDWFKVVGISATQWEIWGMGRATGTEATPFATS